MARRNPIPSYRLHKQSGQAIVTLTDSLGQRRDVLLGKYDSPESRAEYARVLAEWEANGRRLPASKATALDITVNEVILAYWKHAELHYRHPDGTLTGELTDYKYSLKPLREMYGHTAAKDFGPLSLKAVRQAMVEQSVTRKVKVKDPDTGEVREQIKVLRQGLSRKLINQRIGRIRRMFRWAVENELVPPSTLQGLEAVRGLQKGRSKARETSPVTPVALADVEAVLPFLRPAVADMVRLQLHTGMRPGELCIMRAIDLDTTGKVWLYRPGSDQGDEGVHKTAHRGHRRVILLGPRAQEIVRHYLKTDLYAYLFSPREVMQQLRAEQRRNRKTKVQPSQQNRRRKNPKRRPRERYTTGSYNYAVRRACQKAGVPPWHVHQLRHAKATELRREAGLDAARVVLGHRSPQITELYAELDVSRAAEVMEKLG
jgi:integrase